MSGLREQNKEGRRKRILTCARDHFNDRGFEATTIEIIAEAASVSAVTVYNHYRTKGGVLLALVSESDSLLVRKIDQLIAAPPPDVLDAVSAFSRTINDHAFSYLNREVWRHVIATSIIEGNSEFGRVYAELDDVLIGRLAILLTHMSDASGRHGHPWETVAAVLYNLHNARFLEYIMDRTRSASRRDFLTRRDMAFALGQPLAVTTTG